MKKKKLLLTDSVLNLNLKKESFELLEYYNIFTIGDLLEKIENIKQNDEVFKDIDKCLAYFDLNLFSDEKIKSNKHKKNNIQELEKSKNKFNIDEILALDVAEIDIPLNAINELKKFKINTIDDLLQFNPIELVIEGILNKNIVMQIEEKLSYYGLSLTGIVNKEQKLINNDNNIEDIIEEKTSSDEKNINKNSEKNNKKTVDSNEAWWEHFDLLEQFYKENKHIIVLRDAKYKGFGLGSWLIKQRKNYKQGLLSQRAIDAFEQMDIIWNVSSKEGKYKKEYILSSLGIKSLSVIDGKQKNVMDKSLTDILEVNIPKENKIITEELEFQESKDTIISADELKQLIGRLHKESSELETEIKEKKELVKQVEELQTRKTALLTERNELDKKILTLITDDNVKDNDKQYKRGD